jgi:hypothetical protein
MGTPLSGERKTRRWALQSFDLLWSCLFTCKPRARVLGPVAAKFQRVRSCGRTFAVLGHCAGAQPSNSAMSIICCAICTSFMLLFMAALRKRA